MNLEVVRFNAQMLMSPLELYVQTDIRPGVLPKIIEYLVQTREQRGDLDSESGLFDKKINNGVQLAWDVCISLLLESVDTADPPCRCSRMQSTTSRLAGSYHPLP